MRHRILAATLLLTTTWLSCEARFGARLSASLLRHSRERATSRKDALRSSLLLRGGSTKASAADDEHAYRLQQQLYLQSRSMILRQALIARGLESLEHGERAAQPKPMDWDCALSTAKHPKSCLYSFDAEQGAKVIAPIDTDQWITLSALNRLRRTDPSKIEPLWHSQYAILRSWLSPSSPYSLYTHLSPPAALLSFLLDAPILLGLAMTLVMAIGLLMTLPVWERLLQAFLTSRFLWLQWPNWGRFVHAALPLKILLGQMAYKFLADGFGRVHGRLRSALIEMECRNLEASVPLTILEDDEGEEDLGELGDVGGEDVMLEDALSESGAFDDEEEDFDDDE